MSEGADAESDPKNPKIALKPVMSRLSGVLDSVNEKLAFLKEKEKKIIEMAQIRKKKQIDPSVKDELASMAYFEPVLFGNFKPVSPSKSEKPVKKKKEAPILVPAEKPIFRSHQSTGKSAEEKYRLLDSRDKLIQARRNQAPGKRRKLVGTCPDMCPEKERLRRCYQSQLSPFEMVEFPQNVEMKEEWMVKEYARSSADQDTPLPHDLRPVPVLQRTMEHLCRHIADRSEYSDDLLEDWYMFMWDRTRAIRKDLTHQDSCSTSAVTLLEQCARFHIHCAERLVDQDSSVYDDKINTENLTKCLQTLKYMYNDLRSVGEICSNVSEFMSYSLLLNLNNPSIMAEIRDMPDDVMTSEEILFALDVISARETKNYIKFFNLVKNTSYLNCCILRRYFSEIRVHALSTMVRSYCPKRLSVVAVPLLPLVESLMFENTQDCVNHLNLCNVRYDLQEDIAILDREKFLIPEMAFPRMPSVLYIQQKKKVPASEIIWGGPLEEPLPQLPLQNSFDAFGELKMETLNIEDEADEVEEEKILDDYIEEEKAFDDCIEEEDEEEIMNVGDYQNYDDDDDDDGLQEKYVEISQPLFTNAFKSKSIFATSPIASKPVFGGRDEKKPLFSFGNVFNKPEPLQESTKPSPAMFFKPAEEFRFHSYDKKPEVPEIAKPPAVQFSQPKIDPNLKQKEADNLRKQEEEKRRLKDLELQREKERICREKEIQLKKENQIADMRRNEEIKKQQKAFAESQLRDEKLKKLSQKYRWWKVGVFAQAWRQKAWLLSEERKVSRYFDRISREYPPVCRPELLDGNPFELIIPNSLVLQPRSNREFHIPPKSGFPKSGPLPILPLVHMGRAVGASLSNRVQTLYPDPISPFRSCFPWKLVLCLPDEMETSVRLDTFLEMHFVDKFNWKFGLETGPLVSCTHTIGTLELIISIRRIKGIKMWEGSVPNPDAVLGANCLLFFLTDDLKQLAIAEERLNTIRSLPGGKETPVVAFVFGERLSSALIQSALDLNSSCRVVICSGASQQSLVTTLSQSLSLAADISTTVPSVRSVRLDSLYKTSLLDRPWRRVDISLINFDIIMKEPEPLISFFNQCVDNLTSQFLDPNLDKKAHLAVEFESVQTQIEKPLKFTSRPKRDARYCQNLDEYQNRLKLPKWPIGLPKTTFDLNYRLHCYGKLVTNGNKTDHKYLKWRIYEIIQKTLLWKGLDIYCDEDINLILQRFPWVQVFQEFARIRVETTDLSVTYDSSKINTFCYGPSLVNLLGSNKEPLSGFDLNETRPMPEKDGVLWAYSKAVERLKEESELSQIYEPTLSEQVAELLDKSRNCEISPPSDETSALKRSFSELEDRIADISVNLEKRRKILEEIIGDV